MVGDLDPRTPRSVVIQRSRALVSVPDNDDPFGRSPADVAPE